MPSPSQSSIPVLHEHPSSSDPCATITQCLMRYHTGSEEEFSRKAIESLIKKLKDKRDELDALIAAITSQGKLAARCVTIQRTLDGRLQVAGRKGFPHVVYAKIWRWPDLHKNELKHLPICQCAFDLKCDLVCVNPYHYERVVPPGIGSLDLTNLRIENRLLQDGASALSPSSDDSAGCPGNNTETSMSLAQRLALANSSLPQVSRNEVVAGPSVHPVNLDKVLNAGGGLHDVSADLSKSIPSSSGSVNMFAAQGSSIAQNGAGPSSSGSLLVPNASGLLNINNFSTSVTQLQNLSALNSPLLHPIQFEAANWCTITYYEFEKKIGDSFIAKCPTVLVDCLEEAYRADRFCLSSLVNPERSDAIEKCRRLISSGIRLDVRGEGDVWLTCLSRKPVFVRSSYLDRETGRPSGDGVHKVYTQATVKIFDLGLCYRMIQMQRARKVVAADSQTSFQLNETARNKCANIGIEDVRRSCTLLISFVDGWSPGSEPCQSCPCWLEVQTSRAIQILDTALHSPNLI